MTEMFGMVFEKIDTAPTDGTPIFAMMKWGQCYVVRYWSAQQIATDEGSDDPGLYNDGWYEREESMSEWYPSWWTPVENLPAEVLKNLKLESYIVKDG